jgi:hypothetical protein
MLAQGHVTRIGKGKSALGAIGVGSLPVYPIWNILVAIYIKLSFI